ncbi:hypothetical protein B0H19DRAFT_1200342 [Mycena capillaripes]|nr:hypothetical protein B0H19DRAFT_1200342 [Mycena capillaripes]
MLCCSILPPSLSSLLWPGALSGAADRMFFFSICPHSVQFCLVGTSSHWVLSQRDRGGIRGSSTDIVPFVVPSDFDGGAQRDPRSGCSPLS